MKNIRRVGLVIGAIVLLLGWALGAQAAGEFSLDVENGQLADGYYEVELSGALYITPVRTGDWAGAEVTWSSSNENIATVEFGVVFASSTTTGTATITATALAASGASTSQSVNIRVIKPDGTKLTLRSTGNVSSLTKGDTLQMIADVVPSDVKVKWSSSKPAVASINQDGLVKALKAGSTVVSAVAQDGSKAKATMTITVVAANANASSVKLNRTRAQLYVGGVTAKYKSAVQLTAKVKGDSKAALTWSSSDSEVVSVNSKGKLQARHTGTATIKVETANGQSATCKVTVEKVPTGVQLPKTRTVKVKGKLNLKEDLKIDGTITTVAWRSAKPRIAKVNKGIVYGLRPGITKIAVKTVNGKTAVCTVKVTK